MVAVRDPAGHVRRIAVAQRALEDRERQAVDLEVDDSRDLGLDPLAGAPRDPLDDPEGVRVVVVRAEDDVEHDRDRRGDERGGSAHQKLLTSIASSVSRDAAISMKRVEHQHDQEAENEGQRQPDRRDERQDQCVQGSR